MLLPPYLSWLCQPGIVSTVAKSKCVIKFPKNLKKAKSGSNFHKNSRKSCFFHHTQNFVLPWWYGRGLQTPNEALFHWNPELLGLGRQIGWINSWAFGVFSAKLSASILVPWVPHPCFPLFNHYFYKKLSLYILIPENFLELGFEFGPQKIKDLAFMCP